MSDSVLIDPEKCIRCGTSDELTKHHLKHFDKNGRWRKTGEKVTLCSQCHVKIERKINIMLKQTGKRRKSAGDENKLGSSPQKG